MIITFAFTRLAVDVRRWFEVAPDATMEHGARVELRLLDPQQHRGTESASQRTVVDTTFWRADLFDRLDRPGEWAAAHYHPSFDGVEPSDRAWSPELTADPWGWLSDQLHHIEDRLRDAGLDPGIVRYDADDLRSVVPRIVACARQYGPENVMTRDEEFRLTRDAAERVRRMITLVPPTTPLDREYLRPWIEQPG
ncbi:MULTISPECIES: hypothetical protein [Pseudonocardia]|uniref:Uncharacterized protein n=2 Tax=Pseudonocardia TaxID=1847 RepID=A0A1Y2MPR7_PSEAH|nr:MULTISPECIES: hypothetical protein [Pseudonocardia]OSY36979.1 hypothetical protein BG845_05062 [Pseudonocardia autotrophica]TDN75662.1 hypothetical protein C8E95_4840 [Pseudonocardia autotrophica]BBF99634.1 hypothetical protein Pdca_08440 [Pseudonocardia autotrophica]GEC27696.1 hypothetical protein PSA01_47250 [Pseudonocardia saturnea]